MHTNEFITKPVRQVFLYYCSHPSAGTMVTSIYVLADTIIIGQRLGSGRTCRFEYRAPSLQYFLRHGIALRWGRFCSDVYFPWERQKRRRRRLF